MSHYPQSYFEMARKIVAYEGIGALYRGMGFSALAFTAGALLSAGITLTTAIYRNREHLDKNSTQSVSKQTIPMFWPVLAGTVFGSLFVMIFVVAALRSYR
jgi:NADH:ubiquinone oxidoreductase subunit 5 (subunit L)/multisubunit Na+/H+ antiporter MnhA subunit